MILQSTNSLESTPQSTYTNLVQETKKALFSLGQMINSEIQATSSLAKVIEKIKDYLETNPQLLQDPKVVGDLLKIEYQAEFLGKSAPLKAFILKNHETLDLITVKAASKEILLPRLLLKEKNYFCRMLSSPLRESQRQELNLNGDSKEQTLALFEFLRTGQSYIEINESNVFSMLEMADKYEIEPIRKKCETWISEHISLDEQMTLQEIDTLLKIAESYQVPFLCANAEDLVLKAIDFYSKKSGPSGLAASIIQKHGKIVKTLDWIEEKCLNSEDYKFLFESCPNLTFLSLDDILLEDKDILEAIKLKNLTTLSLERCTNITDKSIIQLAHHLKNLKEIHLVFCGKLTDASVIEIAHQLPLLTTLHLVGGYRLTDAAITEIVHHLPLLTSLHLAGCHSITENSFKQIDQHLKNLNDLILPKNHSLKIWIPDPRFV